MMASLPPWVSRAAALALLLAVLALVYINLVSPLLQAYRTTDEDMERLVRLHGRYEALAATRPAYESQLAALQDRQAGHGVYLSGDTDALAAAELQDRVREVIRDHGAKLRSIQILPVKADGNFQRVTVRVQFNGTLAAVHRVLYDLEARKPFAFVENLDIRNRRGTRRNAAENQDPELMIRLDLSGYLRPETV